MSSHFPERLLFLADAPVKPLPPPPSHRFRKPNRYDCFGIEGRTWYVLARFVVAVFLMSLAQIWTDSQPRPDPATCRVSDTLFMIIPNLPRMTDGRFPAHIADLWIGGQLAVFFVWLYLDAPNRQLWVRRWVTLWTYAYGLRALIVGATHYLPPFFKDHAAYIPENVLYGAILITLQLRASLADLMYSGHTVTWVMSALFVWRYSSVAVFAYLYAAAAVVGPILLIAVREHYSADVLVAAAFGGFIFAFFHLWYVRNYRERWIRVWEVEVAQPTRIVYPVSVEMADGTRMVIGADRAGDVELVGAHVGPWHEAYMKWARYLYAEEVIRPSTSNSHHSL